MIGIFVVSSQDSFERDYVLIPSSQIMLAFLLYKAFITRTTPEY